jgi:hypothetical protein
MTEVHALERGEDPTERKRFYRIAPRRSRAYSHDR